MLALLHLPLTLLQMQTQFASGQQPDNSPDCYAKQCLLLRHGPIGSLQEVMVDPVIAADGHTYEKHAMQEWVRDHSTSPVTGCQLHHLKLLPNIIIKNAIAHQQQQLQCL